MMNILGSIPLSKMKVQNGVGDFSAGSHTWSTLIPSEFLSALLKWNFPLEEFAFLM